ncbi:MAG TPA: DUF4385 family protein [Candidatus Thermoplasmatota archaeon]|nr:DUF4385 family protein [Candidatus Thermoplasmatota archaeon]
MGKGRQGPGPEPAAPRASSRAGPAEVDVRSDPKAYRVGQGEEGVFRYQPYKSELLPLWRFATPESARRSSEAILAMFLEYRRRGDGVGMDMARKYLQMGWTRSRRYANRRSGRKRSASGKVLPLDEDPAKAESARIFRAAYLRALEDPVYARWRALQGGTAPSGRRRAAASAPKKRPARGIPSPPRAARPPTRRSPSRPPAGSAAPRAGALGIRTT